MDVVVIGAGLAGARVVESYREAGGGGSVAIVGAELHPPYHRPPLTKRILRGEAEPADALVRAAVDYRALDVDLRLDTAARALDLRNRRVEPSNDYTYDALYRLIQATGREHLGQQGNGDRRAPTAPDGFNTFPIRLDHPNVLAAMGSYVERYELSTTTPFSSSSPQPSSQPVAGATPTPTTAS